MDFRKQRNIYCLAAGLLASLCLGFVLFALFWPKPVRVAVRDNAKAGEAPEVRTVSAVTMGKTVGDVLAENGISAKGYEAEPDVSGSAVGVGEITLSKVIPVTVTVDGEVRTVRTSASTVGEVLEDEGISLAEGDRVSPESQDPVGADTPGITVDHLQVREETRTVAIPREIFTVDADDLAPGESRTENEGKDGVMEVTEEVSSLAGEEQDRKTVSEKTLEDPEPKIVGVGTGTQAESSGGGFSARPASGSASGIANTTRNADGSVDILSDDSYARLVNSGHPLPADYEPDDLVDVGGTKLRKDAADAFNKMREAMAEDTGIDLKPLSGYRSYSTQAGLSGDSGTAGAGYSEHQTGLACDFGSDECEDFSVEGFGSSEAYRWLCANAHRFGFELTMPENTYYGVGWEPWHWRFVGADLAPRIRQAQDDGSVVQYDDFCDKYL